MGGAHDSGQGGRGQAVVHTIAGRAAEARRSVSVSVAGRRHAEGLWSQAGTLACAGAPVEAEACATAACASSSAAAAATAAAMVLSAGEARDGFALPLMIA